MSVGYRPAGERFVTDQPGIRTWHCFSSGAHYDPDNIGFGPLIAVDWHRVDPGAGFAAHRHRDLEIVSVVLSGTLHHGGTAGEPADIPAGQGQYLSAGTGVVHSEVNPSATEVLEFVQVWLRADHVGRPPRYTAVERVRDGGTVAVDGARWCVPSTPWHAAAPRAFVLALTDDVSAAGQRLAAGDQLRLVARPVEVTGPGRALVWLLPR